MSMRSFIFLLLFSLSYLSCGSVVDTGWDEYWSKVCDGGVDLHERVSWRHFLEMARNKYGEANPLFQSKTTPTGFVDQAVREILKGKKEVRGLLAAQLILQYHPLDLLGYQDLPPAASSSHQQPRGVALQASGLVKPADPETAANLAIICRNLGIPVPESYAKMASSYVLPLEKDPLKLFSYCSLKDFGPDSPLLTVKTLAAYLGDGAINGEVDADFNPLEGHSTTVTACVMANLLHRLAGKAELMDVGELDHSALIRDREFFLQAAATPDLMRECASYPNPEEAFEMALLERLRTIRIDEQVLLSIGFSQHAMAMAIKKTGPSHYELLIFNSGRGIGYHESSVEGSKQKVFPAKRFSGLTLLRLKWSQVLQRLYHVYAIGDKIIENPDSEATSSTAAEDVYVTALAGLRNYEVAFAEADMEAYRLFVAQRSGNCSMEVLMAFLAHETSRPYQKLKIFLYKDLLELAFQKRLREEEKPVVHRLLKYGLEKHARTVLRFRRRQYDDMIPLEHLLPEGMWLQYAKVKDVYLPARPAEFRVDTSSLQDSAEFYDRLMNKAQTLNAGITGELQASAAVHFAPPGHCAGYAKSVFTSSFDGGDSAGFRGYLWDLRSYMRECRFKPDNYEALLFLAFSVVRRWPAPEAACWRALLGPANTDHGVNLEALWLFLQQIFQGQVMCAQGGVYVYTCLHKIMMITQYAVDGFLPGLADCSVGAPFYLDSAAHYCLSRDIAAYHGLLTPKTERCFGEGGKPAGRLLEHLRALANTYSPEYGDFDPEKQPLAVLREQRNPKIPAALYYWHALRNAVASLERKAPDGWNVSFFKMAGQEYVPTRDIRDAADLTRGVSNECSEVGPISRGKPRAVEADREYDWAADHQVYGDTRQNILMTVLSSKYDQLGRYIHLLRVSPDEFDWSTTLHLGALVVHRPHPLGTRMDAAAFLDQHLGALRAELVASREILRAPAAKNPEMKRRAERYAALVVIESIVGDLEKSGKHLSDLKLLLGEQQHLHASYRAMFVFAYLAALPKDPRLEEAENAIALYKEYAEVLKRHVPEQDDVRRYRDHIQANVLGAFFAIALSDAPSQSIKRIVGGDRGDDLVSHGFLSTTQHTRSNYIFDFVSGFEVSHGFLNIETTPDSLRQHYRNILLPDAPADIRIGASKILLRQGGFLIRCQIAGGGREFQRHALHYRLADVDIWNGTNPSNPAQSLTVIREGYAVTSNHDGVRDYRQAIRLPYHTTKEGLPIPANVDKSKPYSILVFPDHNEAAFLNGSEQIWVEAGGLLSFGDPHLRRLQYMPFNSESDFVSPLATYNGALCFKDPHGTLLLLLKDYADASGNPLWFIKGNTGHWELLSDRKFHVRPIQDFATAGMLPKYLLLEGREKSFKVILPEEYHQVTAKGDTAAGGYEGAEIRKGCLSISLTRTAKGYTEDEYLSRLTSPIKKGHGHAHSLIPHSKSRQESLLLLYNYLVTRHYHEAMKEADKIHQMEPFDASEHRLLGWIAKSNEAMKNGAPESIAIRAYIAFHVYNNEMLFHSLGEADQRVAYFTPYMETSQWPQYWAAEHLSIAAEVISRYVDRLSKIPAFLRFDPEARFPRLSPALWSTWLQQLARNPNADLSLLLYLQPTDQRYFDLPNSRGGDAVVQRFKSPESLDRILRILGKPRRMQEALPAKSFLTPALLLNKRNWLLAKIVSGQLSTDAAEQLDQWLQPYENIPQYAIVAKTLRKALSLSQSHPVPGDTRQLLEELIAGQPTEPQTPAADVPYRARSARHFPEQPYASPMWTADIEDNIFGVPFPLAMIKRRRCQAQELGSILDPFLAKVAKAPYFSDRPFVGDERLLQKLDVGHKLKLTQRLAKLYELHLLNSFVALGYQDHERGIEMDSEIGTRLEYIAHGKISITASDVIHMYAKADEKCYRQYFPHFNGKPEALHRLATEFVLAHSNWQEVKRFRQFLASNSDPATLDQEKCQLCRSTETGMNNMLAYECFINSRLTKGQVDKIRELTRKTDGRYPDMFVHWIMSAGKTYILGTLLSVMKADHDHLSILVVPKSLLTGEASNLFSRTIAAFNRDGFSFRLARDPKLSDFKTLAWLNESLRSAASRGQYLIMSADMLEGLHDKFVELGREGDWKRREYEEMREMLRTIRVWGALTVDEAHKIFDPAQETNFPIATSKANGADMNSTLALEGRVLAEVFRIVAEDRDLQKNVLRMSIAENRPMDQSQTEHVISSIGYHLVWTMVTQGSALSNYIKQVDPNALKPLTSFNKEDLHTFITTDPKRIKTSQIEKISLHASPALYRALAVCRLAVTTLIPLAWSGNVNENYGLEPGKKYAIPFSAAFAPKSGSEFAFRWYCYGRTIRTYLVKGFDEETVEWAVTWLQSWALKNITLPPARQSELPGKVIRTVFGLASIYDLNPQNEEQLLGVLDACRRYHKGFTEDDDNSLSPDVRLYSEFLFRWIAEDVIPSIGYYSEQISANSQDIAYMVSSRQLYSGSVISRRTFPRGFLEHGLVEIDPSIEADILEAIGRNNIGVAVIPDGLSADAFVEDRQILLARKQIKEEASPLVALLDVGAYFKDQTNEQVAASLLGLQDSVLYFSTGKNKLALISRADRAEKLLHTYSAEILGELVEDGSQRITFYDQQHNTGVDIFQDPRGCAMVIIGPRTTAIDFFQSVMRMRKFLERQRLFIVVPRHVARMIVNDASVPALGEILRFMETNLRDSVMGLNVMALSQMIGAVFKEAAYRRLLEGTIDKAVLGLWVKDTSSEITDLVVPQRYRDYRRRVVPSIIASYVARVRDYFDGDPEELEDLIRLAEDTVEKAFGGPADGAYPSRSLCSVPVVETDEIDDDEHADAGQEVRIVENKDSDMLAITAVETETHVVTETVNEVHTSNRTIRDRVNWNLSQIPGNVYDVNGLLNHNTRTNTTLFSPSLMISYGFAVRGTLFGAHRKFAPHCLALFDNNRRRLVMVDQFEAAEISAILQDGRPSGHGSIMSGLVGDFFGRDGPPPSVRDYTIFGMSAALVDPVRGTIDFGKSALGVDGELMIWLQPLMVEAMFFAGYLKELLMPTHKEAFLGFLESPRPWPHLSPTASRSFKLAVLTDVIVSEEEVEKSTEYLHNDQSLVEYVGAPMAAYHEAKHSDPLAMFSFVSQNRAKLEAFVHRLQTNVLLHQFNDLILCNQISTILNPSYLYDAMHAALAAFFRNPSIAQRGDFGWNANAISQLFLNHRYVPDEVAKGVLHILHNCNAYPHWRSYEVIFNVLSSRILDLVQNNSHEQWALDYLNALVAFQNPEHCVDLFAALVSPYAVSRVPGIMYAADSPYLEVIMRLSTTIDRIRQYSLW